MINIKSYLKEADTYKNKKDIYNKLLELKESYLGTNHSGKSKIEIYNLAINIIQELFNPLQLYSEPLIPLSFFKSCIGQTLFSIINDNENRVITIRDMVDMSKTINNKKGYSYQYINKEIKAGRLQATMYNGRWEISYDDALKFLEKKRIL